MNEPRAYTVEECRNMFIDHIKGIVRYWEREAKNGNPHAISGVAHSILVTIDGGSGYHPALKLLTDPHPNDEQYHKELGENWYPAGADITHGVQLHDLLHER